MNHMLAQVLVCDESVASNKLQLVCYFIYIGFI